MNSETNFRNTGSYISEIYYDIIPVIDENRKVWYDSEGLTTECSIRVSTYRRTKERNGMVKGLGLDLCEISRMEKLLENDRFLNRYFTEEEASYIRSKGKNAAQTAAGIYAAKEALTKALGTGIVFDLKEIEVIHDDAGKPGYRLKGKAAELADGDCCLLSISHDGGIAAAVCVREQRQ